MELCRGCFGAANNDCRDCVRKKGEVSYKKDARRKSNKWKKTQVCDRMEKKTEGGKMSEGSSGD